MKFKKTLASTLLGVLLAQSVFAAAPTSGAYVTDFVNSYVNDDGLRSLDTVGMILCFMGALRAEQKVGAGPYKALVDKSKCEKTETETTSAGASSAVSYTNTVVEATRASSADPMLGNAWVLMKEGVAQTIYTNTSISEGVSSSAPNGVFTMNFSGYLDATPTTLGMKGTLTSTGSTLTFYEEGDQGFGAYSNALTLTQSGTDSGSGRASASQAGQATTDSTFAYSSTYFKRKKGTEDTQCFSRSADSADVSTWRYGVYKADGTRLDLDNPGFSLTYTSIGGSPVTYYGYAGFNGVNFPDAALTAMGSSATLSRPGSSDPYAFTKVGGKLTKLTKVTTTLDTIKGMPIRIWVPSGGELELVWDGTNMTKTRTISCNQGGCISTAASGNVTAADLVSLGLQIAQGWSDSLGGSVAMGITSAFASATPIYYRTRSTVTSAAANALTLSCVSECLDNTTGMSAALLTGSPYVTVGSSAYNYLPMLATVAKTYTFSAGMMQYGSVAVDASAFSSSQLAGNYQWGLRTGSLVSAADTSVKCNSNGDANTAGDYICPLLIGEAADIYEWETGNKSWNQNATLTLNATAVTFDAPKRLSVTVSASNSTLPAGNSKIGATMVMNYNGFGDLQGIPGSCYNKTTNAKTTCSSVTGYAPDFSLKAGAELTEGSTTYYVKPIDQELRFSKVADSFCDSLTLPTTATLPGTATDPKATIGALPVVADSVAPAVIHGIVQ